ncbi:MAG: cryptochrome/photolyase family protein [Gemmatimonadales bacterium]
MAVLPDRRFLTSRADFAGWSDGRKLYRMEDFYRWQRKRLGTLLDRDGNPVGGRWNFDPENRLGAKALQRHGTPPAPKGFPVDDVTRKVTALVDSLPDHWGTTAGFDLPTSRTAALEALDEFIAERLEWFGPFQDAIVSGDDYGFHARIAPAMNVGLLHPGEIVDRAVSWLRDRARAGQRRTGPARDEWQRHLPSVEGFVRQVIGWREYVNGIYWRFMPEYRNRNYFGRTRRLPALYWDPDRTDLACLADAVRGVRDTAYAHHIRRLMVLANFATLVEVDPWRSRIGSGRASRTRWSGWNCRTWSAWAPLATADSSAASRMSPPPPISTGCPTAVPDAATTPASEPGVMRVRSISCTGPSSTRSGRESSTSASGCGSSSRASNEFPPGNSPRCMPSAAGSWKISPTKPPDGGSTTTRVDRRATFRE